MELDLKRLNTVGPLRFQRYLPEIIEDYQPRVIVETGTRSGVATVIIANSMGEDAYLYSCDVLYKAQSQAEEAIQKATGFPMKNFPRWTYQGERSQEALPKIPDEQWDLFIHDSDHGEKCMRFEMDFAWERLRDGGVMIVDDWDTCAQASEEHEAFLEFIDKHGLDFSEIDTAAFVVKR